jgi:S-adenosylmethionine/arginine decarboxylase-like enzyme
MKEPYGLELILDLHDCSVQRFNRTSLGIFFRDLCKHIGMKDEDLHFWDYDGVPEEERDDDPKIYGTSAIQFIRTSNVTIHCLDKLGAVYINIFSCRDFDTAKATGFCANFFGGAVVNQTVVDRR